LVNVLAFRKSSHNMVIYSTLDHHLVWIRPFGRIKRVGTEDSAGKGWTISDVTFWNHTSHHIYIIYGLSLRLEFSHIFVNQLSSPTSLTKSNFNMKGVA